MVEQRRRRPTTGNKRENCRSCVHNGFSFSCYIWYEYEYTRTLLHAPSQNNKIFSCRIQHRIAQDEKWKHFPPMMMMMMMIFVRRGKNTICNEKHPKGYISSIFLIFSLQKQINFIRWKRGNYTYTLQKCIKDRINAYIYTHLCMYIEGN